jgi:hypothetical protein
VGDKTFYLLDILFHRFFDGSGGSVAQIPQREFTDMFGQTDAQAVQDTESSDMGGHQGSIQQYQSANQSAECRPSPPYHGFPVCTRRISAVRQQFFQDFIDGPIGHKHTYCTTGRQ